MSWVASEAFAAQANTGLDSCGDLTVPCDVTCDRISGKNCGKVFGLGIHGVASVVEATADGILATCIPPATTVPLAAAANPTRTAPTPANCVQRRTPRPSKPSSQPIDAPYSPPEIQTPKLTVDRRPC
jgi:hypothetical protein